jgi:hypothetical protein
MRKIYQTPTVVVLGTATRMTMAGADRGPIMEAFGGSTTSAMLDL